MSWRRVALIVLLIVSSFTAGAYAASNVEKIEAFLRHDFQVFLDGKKADVGPVLVYGGRSYLPLSKTAELLNVDVKWQESNKGIYVNSRFVGQPGVPSTNESIEVVDVPMAMPMGYTLSTSKGTYAVLGNSSMADGTLYYRDTDIQRMGVDTRGLRKVRDPLTKALYLTQAEIATVVTERMTFTAMYDPVVTGESNSVKIKVVTDFMEFLPEYRRMVSEAGQYAYFPAPYVYAIDAIGNNEYEILAQEGYTTTGLAYYKYTMTLEQRSDGTWTHTKFTSTPLN